MLNPMWVAAQNLVPNPSFEEFDECPVNNSWIDWGLVNNWTAPYGNADYYHECGSNGYGVPMNIYGGGYLIQDKPI